MNADEKTCPFCAETIKAAAVKCRFCQSDLPAGEDVPPALAAPAELEPEVEGGEGADEFPPPPAVETPPGAPAPAAARATGLRIVLVAASLLLAAGSAWFFLNDRGGERADGLTLGSDQQVVTTSFRTDAQEAAAAKAATILSYSFKTLEEDEAKARALMAPSFAEKYDEAMAKNGPTAVSGKITQKATVVGASLVSIEPRSARVLLFVDLSTTAGDSPTPRPGKERAVMTMTRKDGEWIVTDVDAF